MKHVLPTAFMWVPCNFTCKFIAEKTMVNELECDAQNSDFEQFMNIAEDCMLLPFYRLGNVQKFWNGCSHFDYDCIGYDEEDTLLDPILPYWDQRVYDELAKFIELYSFKVKIKTHTLERADQPAKRMRKIPERLIEYM